MVKIGVWPDFFGSLVETITLAYQCDRIFLRGDVYPASPGRYLPPDGKCLHFSGRTRNPKTEFLGSGRTFYRSGRIRQSKRGQPSLCLIGRTGRHVVTYGYFNFGIFEYAGTPGGTFPQRRQPLCFFQSHHYIGYRRYGALSDPATPTKCRV